MALERDVVLATLYNSPAVLILRHQTGPNSAEVHIHMLGDMGQAPIKSHVLKMGLSGRFAINIVDDIIIVHHQVGIYLASFFSALSRIDYILCEKFITSL